MTEQNTLSIDELQQKANDGDAQAQFDLALCYAKGTGVEKNEEIAFNWHKKAAEQGHVNAQFALGLYYLLSKDRVQQAQKLLDKWMSYHFISKDVDPAFDLAVRQAWEITFSRADDDLAFAWLKKAAKQDHAEANYWLGICYRDGIGTEQNDEPALDCFKIAAEQGFAEAYYWRALCYRDGNGVEQNNELALEWITKAVEHADYFFRFNKYGSDYGKSVAEAYLFLGDLYAHGKGVEQNDELAFTWYEKAAEKDAIEAQYRLANCYYHGQGVEKNNNHAFDYYQKAALAGHALAKNRAGEMCFATGTIIIFGKGKEEGYDYDQAFELFTKSIEYDHIKTYGDLGEYYCSFDYNESYKMAIDWYEEAAKQGDVEAGNWLAKICSKYGILYYIGDGVEIDKDYAFKLFLKAAEYGSAEATCQASFMLLNQAENNEEIGGMVFEGFKIAAEQSENSDIKKMANSLLGHCYAKGIGIEQNHELAEHHWQLGSDPNGWDLDVMWLPPKSQLAKEMLDISLGIHFENKDLESAKELINQAFEDAKGVEKGFKKVSFLAIEQAEKLAIKNQELEEKNQQLQKAKDELEDMMSMFAHKFRSPLDAIIYNTTHENQVKLYTEAAQTMRGLLNIFSIISTDAEILKEKVKQDRLGNGRLANVFSKMLDMILLHLLSVSGAEKIQQHYMAYAKAHGQCDAQVSYKNWCEDYFELEQSLQAEWEQSFALLLNQSATLEQRFVWLEQHFFKLELIGFERADIQFKEYGVTESLLTILLNEILVNAFKYYSSASKQPVVLEWTEREGYQVLICRNPSIRSERDIIKGSNKGHVFLSTLARKTGSAFTKPMRQDDFVVEFGIPDELLISK